MTTDIIGELNSNLNQKRVDNRKKILLLILTMITKVGLNLIEQYQSNTPSALKKLLLSTFVLKLKVHDMNGDVIY
jgi:hypothetical protein